MASQKGYSIARPPIFNNVKTQFSVKEGFKMLVNEFGEVHESSKWTEELKKKAQTNAKATQTTQCGLALDQLNKLGPFKSFKGLWVSFMKEHMIHGLPIFSWINYKIGPWRKKRPISQIHGRFKQILNEL